MSETEPVIPEAADAPEDEQPEPKNDVVEEPVETPEPEPKP